MAVCDIFTPVQRANGKKSGASQWRKRFEYFGQSPCFRHHLDTAADCLPAGGRCNTHRPTNLIQTPSILPCLDTMHRRCRQRRSLRIRRVNTGAFHGTWKSQFGVLGPVRCLVNATRWPTSEHTVRCVNPTMTENRIVHGESPWVRATRSDQTSWSIKVLERVGSKNDHRPSQIGHVGHLIRPSNDRSIERRSDIKERITHVSDHGKSLPILPCSPDVAVDIFASHPREIGWLLGESDRAVRMGDRWVYGLSVGDKCQHGDAMDVDWVAT